MKYLFTKNYGIKIIRYSILIICVFLFSSCCTVEECKCDEPKNEEIDYTQYFIAHAGGTIDGLFYTNSLEALNLSYEKGCKLFELDLTYTSDRKIVAVHYWEYYKTITGYSGKIDNTPLTEEEFLSYKIHGEYTPLNMDAINIWFKNHPDATLVTDKINEPQKIYNDFQFRDRVIMELFSWDAVDKAIELGIKPLASYFLFFETPNFEKVFEEKKIEFICMPRSEIAGNEDLFRRLKAKGIKNYVFGLESPINGQPSEQYVWNYEMNFCYGMYANDLDLLTTLMNGQSLKKREPFVFNKSNIKDFDRMK